LPWAEQQLSRAAATSSEPASRFCPGSRDEAPRAAHGFERQHGALAERELSLRHPRFHLHFTPTYSSWINQVERWFAALTDKQIRRGSHRSTRALEDAIRVYLANHNAKPKPFVWVKSADEIIDSIARFALRTSGTGHEVYYAAGPGQ
jgi:DDE superfamily endonuclease